MPIQTTNKVQIVAIVRLVAIVRIVVIVVIVAIVRLVAIAWKCSTHGIKHPLPKGVLVGGEGMFLLEKKEVNVRRIFYTTNVMFFS